MRCEVACQPPGTALLAIDLNADVSDVPGLQELLQDGWFDLGGIAETWGQPNVSPTCVAPNSSKATRRDFILVNRELLHAIAKFKVVLHDLCPVHGTLQLQIALKEADYAFYKAIKPASLKQLLDDHFNQCFGSPINLPSDQDVLSSWTTAEPELCTFGSERMRLHPFDLWGFKLARSNARVQREQLMRQYMSNFNIHLDTVLDGLSLPLQAAIDDWNLNCFWKLFSDALEHATLSYTCTYQRPDWAKYTGRGSSSVRKTWHRPHLRADGNTQLILE